MKEVTIIYRNIPQYRVEFYNQLRSYLLKNDIKLILIYGDNQFAGRGDAVAIDWANFVSNTTIKLGSKNLIWQPCLSLIKNSELVIVEQANMLLLNYILILRSKILRRKFAFWGHGQNKQDAKDSFLNKFKTLYLDYCDWWFPYTNGVREFLISNGVSDKKISVVQNAIDTRTLRKQYLSVEETKIEELKLEYQISPTDRVFVYCGALSWDKNLDFLLNVASKINQRGLNFKLLIAGNGPEQAYVAQQAKIHDYLVYVGPKFNKAKAEIFRLAELSLLPGAMGLAVLDSFAMETPIITIEYPYHGPEIEYLKNEYNGIITQNSEDSFVNGIFKLINDEKLYKSLVANGINEIEKYTIENMVKNFGAGIIDCMNSKRG